MAGMRQRITDLGAQVRYSTLMTAMAEDLAVETTRPPTFYWPLRTIEKSGKEKQFHRLGIGRRGYPALSIPTALAIIALTLG